MSQVRIGTETPSKRLDIAHQTTHGSTLMSLRGEVDVATANRLCDALQDAMAEGAATIALDASELEFIDSTGLSVLVSAMRQLGNRPGLISLLNPTPTVRHIFDVAGISPWFMDPSPADASAAGDPHLIA